MLIHSAPITSKERSVGPTLALKRNAKRQASRERIHSRVAHPIDTPRLMRDPLERRESKALSAITGMRLLVGAGIIHGLVIVGFALVSQVVGEQREFRPPERLKVSIIEPPKVEPPPVEEPKKVAAPLEPEFTPPTPPKPVEPARKPPPVPTAPIPPVAEVSPDPMPRRIVGLSLESTVQGNGPAFATGTTRMGATDLQAVDPKLATKTPSVAAAGVAPSAASTGSVQRVASRIPTRDTQFEKPKRTKPNKPEYPATLKAQAIEGEVVVSVDIAASGDVTRVTIVRGSGYAAFDDAARRAALAERFAPATRDGQPVAFTLSYSYRFRIED